MQEVGIDISNKRDEGVGEYLGKVQIQYRITSCDDADTNCPTVAPGVKRRRHWSHEDPTAAEGTDEQKLAKFREIGDRIEKKIED